jgi:hypothetical protein
MAHRHLRGLVAIMSPATQAVLPSASPSSFDDEEVEGDEHDIHNVREELGNPSKIGVQRWNG